MKYIFLVLFLFSITNNNSYCQKKIINNDAVRSWVSLKEIDGKTCLVSNDGKYVAFIFGSQINGDSLQVKSIEGNILRSFKIKREDLKEHKIEFTKDGANLFFLIGGDSLGIYNLSKNSIRYISNVKFFKISPDGKLIAYMQLGNSKELVLNRIDNSFIKRIQNVEDYRFNEFENNLFICTNSSLIFFHPKSGKYKEIYTGSRVSFLTFSKHSQAAFIASSNETFSIYTYNIGDDSAKGLVCDTFKINGRKINIVEDELCYTPDGNKLFFSIESDGYQGQILKSSNTNGDQVWSYKDKFIGRRGFKPENIKVAFNFSGSKIMELTTPLTSLVVSGGTNKYIISITKQNTDEFYWNRGVFSAFLISLEDGKKEQFYSVSNILNLPSFSMSPSEEFVVWFDDNSKQYKSYNVISGKEYLISNNIPVPVYDYEGEIPARRFPFGIGGWLKSGKILIYSRFGLWAVDPRGTEKAVRISSNDNKYGRVVFRNISDNLQFPLLVSAFNSENKQNGLLIIDSKRGSAFNDDHLSNNVYYGNSFNETHSAYVSNNLPIKVNNSNLYIVYRMNSKESPNLFTTQDFINYKEFTHIHPEANYNWMSTELISWKLVNGKESLGILYKPENFDSLRKYPIIFHYYEKYSDELNVFKTPQLSVGNLSIPFYVSKGYLVFVPDMHYLTGGNAYSIANTIFSAITKLKTYPWIDSDRIGLQGHSFGGYETMILISRMNIFKAAQESSGPINLTSFFSHINDDRTRQRFSEFEQLNIGSSLWDNPELYLNNSPIFEINNINTPLLIMHGKLDHIVSSTQSMDLFAGLRRLNKPVWLLMYNNEHHTLLDKSHQIDFQNKQMEFFDYYLMGDPEPEWMK
jgi:dipeptidyl aminopeptidase/acylaminoacyl peptidase